MTSGLLLITLIVLGVTASVFWATSVRTLTIYPNKDSWQSVPPANNGRSDNFEITSYNKPPYNITWNMELPGLVLVAEGVIITTANHLKAHHKSK